MQWDLLKDSMEFHHGKYTIRRFLMLVPLEDQSQDISAPAASVKK